MLKSYVLVLIVYQQHIMLKIALQNTHVVLLLHFVTNNECQSQHSYNKFNQAKSSYNFVQNKNQP